MASSGSFNTSGYEGRYLQFSWKQTGQNVTNNTTTISWTLKGAGGGSVWYKAGNFKVVIAGETVYSSSARIELSDGTVVASGTYTFKHNADGTKSFSASAQAGIYTVAVNCTGSGSFTLNTIPRASQPSCITWPEHTQNVGYFGDEISIHMNRNSADFTHTVRYQFGSVSGTIAEGVETGVRWVIPLSLMDLLPAVTSGSGTIYVDTYNGSTKIGTKWCGFTAKVPASVKPTCTFTLEDITGVDDIYGSPVKGLSKIKVTVTANEAYSSPIASCVISANGVRYSGLTATTGLLKTSGTSTVTATVTDKRGRSGSVSYDMSVQNYAAPAVTALSVRRCNQDGTANKRGGYIKVTFSAAISSMSSKNNALYYLYYKKSTDSSYTKVSLTALTNQYSVSNYSYIFDASTSSSYDVRVEAVDRHITGAKSTKAPTAASIFSWRGFKTSNGVEDGVGIGKVPNKPNTLQVGWDAEFDKTVVQTGNSYCSYSLGTSGVKGYVKAARIEVVHTNANAPITFYLTRRNADTTMTVHVRFLNVSNTTPGVDCITYEGENYEAFLYQESSSVWVLYVAKTAQNDPITVQRWTTSPFMDGRVVVTFPNNEQSDTLPEPYYRATPARMQSIIDLVFPVGHIMLLYSHANPSTMYPGTTWERISNAFLWAVDASGTIGLTGGERTHKLTTAEMPSHSHGAVYSGNASGDKNLPWLSTSVLGTGDKLAYSTIATGGSEAHNNMPPYIQISAWRRTA